MERRQFLSTGTIATTALLAGPGTSRAAAAEGQAAAKPVPGELKLRPAEGPMDVAFCISQNSNVIDMAGPWEVFQDVSANGDSAFRLFTVAEKKDSVRATGGLHLIPDHTFEDAPTPRVVVVPAIRGTEGLWSFLRKMSTEADLVMSVCTGAFQLARAGLLDGRNATTHHEFWDEFEKTHPKVKLERGPRYVEHAKVATAGGLTSGIDLALRVVERYFDRATAQATATYMEYRGDGWRG